MEIQRVYNPHKPVFTILILAVSFLALCKLVSMSRVLIVSGIDDDGPPQKLLLREDEMSKSVQDIYDIVRKRRLPSSSRDFVLEIFSKEKGTFVRFGEDLLDFRRGFLHVLVVPQQSHSDFSSPTSLLCIKGREFDIIREPLFIGPSNRRIIIQETSEAHKGTGLITWDGSVVLAKYLEKNAQKLVSGKRILELGSGTGLTGIAAVFLGAKNVLLTDLSYTLNQLNYNVAANCNADELRDNAVVVAELDWAREDTYPSPFIIFDTVVAADVVWIEELVVPLVNALSRLCTKDYTVLVLSHQSRTQRCDDLLFSTLKQKGFIMSKEPEGSLDANYSAPRVSIYKGMCTTI
jgi:predicted nicotinamide N-methyase